MNGSLVVFAFAFGCGCSRARVSQAHCQVLFTHFAFCFCDLPSSSFCTHAQAWEHFSFRRRHSSRCACIRREFLSSHSSGSRVCFVSVDAAVAAVWNERYQFHSNGGRRRETDECKDGTEKRTCKKKNVATARDNLHCVHCELWIGYSESSEQKCDLFAMARNFMLTNECNRTEKVEPKTKRYETQWAVRQRFGQNLRLASTCRGSGLRMRNRARIFHRDSLENNTKHSNWTRFYWVSFVCVFYFGLLPFLCFISRCCFYSMHFATHIFHRFDFILHDFFALLCAFIIWFARRNSISYLHFYTLNVSLSTALTTRMWRRRCGCWLSQWCMDFAPN